MDEKIIIALIALAGTFATSITAIAIAAWNSFASKKNAENLESLKDQITEQSKERDARRDYEYEARKRLYHECEPLLFQMREASEDALHRIFSLARTCKQGHLEPGHGSWLESREYYLLSTIYMLITPLAIYRLLKKELTLVDLNVDLSIRYRYEAYKRVYLSFTDDFHLAGCKEKIEYDPFANDWQNKRTQYPANYWRQGVVLCRLEKMIESIIIKKDNSRSRWMNFGEFEAAYQTNTDGFKEKIEGFEDIFRNFNPRKMPILWRVLLYQAYLHNIVLKSSSDMPVYFTEAIDFDKLIDFEINKLDWCNPQIDQDGVWNSHFAAVQLHIEKNLSTLFSIFPKTSSSTNTVSASTEQRTNHQHSQ